MHGFPFLNSPFAPELAAIFIPLILATVVGTLILKGFTLWISARAGQKGWFIAFLLINTAGILEIVYLIWLRPKKPDAGESAPIVSSSVQ